MESCVIYLVQISTLAKYHDCGDSMDVKMMAYWPTKSRFDALQQTTTDPDLKCKRRLYLATKCILAVITLDMIPSHGLAVIQKT